MMKKTIVAVALLVGAGAGTASAQTVNMAGSDTLYNVTRTLVASLGIALTDLNYAGGGSGLGETAIVGAGNTQELAPMSRFMGNTASTCASATQPATAGCWRIGKDLLTVWGNDVTTCDALTWGNTITVSDATGNNDGTFSCPECTGAGLDQFAFGDWRTVLRVIYGGQHSSAGGNTTAATKFCSSDVRAQLVNSWTSLFKDGCTAGGTTCTSLRRAWRRDDVSGTSESFRDNLKLPAWTDVPFCNGTERQDNDVIRRACDGTGFNGAGEEACRNTNLVASGQSQFPNVAAGYNLGLVVPVLIPSVTPYGSDATLANQNCGTASFGGAAFAPLAWGFQDSGLYGPTCPNGQPPVGGTCMWPKRSGSAAGTGFGCIAGKNDRPVGSPSSVDGRTYNLWTRNPNGAVLSYNHGSAQRTNVSYYRAHQKQCQFLDATDQIGCFVKDDSCTIGFAGSGAGASSTGITGLALRSSVVQDHDANPATPSIHINAFPVEPDFAFYPLARFLYICTWDDFANTGSQLSNFVTAQQTLRAGLVDPTPVEVHDAIQSEGFIPFDPALPLTFDACP